MALVAIFFLEKNTDREKKITIKEFSFHIFFFFSANNVANIERFQRRQNRSPNKIKWRWNYSTLKWMKEKQWRTHTPVNMNIYHWVEEQRQSKCVGNSSPLGNRTMRSRIFEMCLGGTTDTTGKSTEMKVRGTFLGLTLICAIFSFLFCWFIYKIIDAQRA